MMGKIILLLMIYTLPANPPSLQIHQMTFNSFDHCTEYLNQVRALYAEQMAKDGRQGVWRLAGFCYQDSAR